MEYTSAGCGSAILLDRIAPFVVDNIGRNFIVKKANPAPKARPANQAALNELIAQMTVDANGEDDNSGPFGRLSTMMSLFPEVLL
jgi:hypothetical protein